jgi:hypothetical protein
VRVFADRYQTGSSTGSRLDGSVYFRRIEQMRAIEEQNGETGLFG